MAESAVRLPIEAKDHEKGERGRGREGQARRKTSSSLSLCLLLFPRALSVSFFSFQTLLLSFPDHLSSGLSFFMFYVLSTLQLVDELVLCILFANLLSSASFRFALLCFALLDRQTHTLSVLLLAHDLQSFREARSDRARAKRGEPRRHLSRYQGKRWRGYRDGEKASHHPREQGQRQEDCSNNTRGKIGSKSIQKKKKKQKKLEK